MLVSITSVSAKTVLVTGSNRGIGLEFVNQYAAAGWDVIATSRTPDDDADLRELAATQSNITVELMDVTNLEQITALARRYDGTAIDLLINNAGMIGGWYEQKWGALDRDLFEDMMAVNVFGPMKVTEAFADHVASSTDKKIVVISSQNGSLAKARGQGRAYYGISKAAVNMAMRGRALHLKDQGVIVGILHPGGVNTRMLRQGFGLTKEEAEATDTHDFGFTPMTPEQSVTQMIKTIESLTIERSGDFLRYDGATVPW